MNLKEMGSENKLQSLKKGPWSLEERERPGNPARKGKKGEKAVRVGRGTCVLPAESTGLSVLSALVGDLLCKELRAKKVSEYCLQVPKKTTQRPGCEKHEFIRTHLHTQGGLPVKSLQHKRFSTGLYRVQRTKKTG